MSDIDSDLKALIDNAKEDQKNRNNIYYGVIKFDFEILT